MEEILQLWHVREICSFYSPFVLFIFKICLMASLILSSSDPTAAILSMFSLFFSFLIPLLCSFLRSASHIFFISPSFHFNVITVLPTQSSSISLPPSLSLSVSLVNEEAVTEIENGTLQPTQECYKTLQHLLFIVLPYFLISTCTWTYTRLH